MLCSTVHCFMANATNSWWFYDHSGFADLTRPNPCQTVMLIYVPRQSCYRWPGQLLPVKPGMLSGDMVFFKFLNLYLKLPHLPLASSEQFYDLLGQSPEVFKRFGDTSQMFLPLIGSRCILSVIMSGLVQYAYGLRWNASFDFVFPPKVTTILRSFSVVMLLSSKWKGMPVTGI